MDRLRYLELLDVEGSRLSQAAAHDLDAVVAWCPGWTVRDVVAHTAEVYEHKILCVRMGGEPPDPWPPEWPATSDPLPWFADAHHRLLETLGNADPAASSWTWWPAEQSVSFWLRRMAQETAIHRVDAQSALGEVTAVGADLAVDGIDEVLVRMLGGDWSDDPQPGPTATIDVSVDGYLWQVMITPDEVTVGDVARQADAQVSGDPSEVLLWAWGRAPHSAVHVVGDPAVARQLRERLRLATQ